MPAGSELALASLRSEAVSQGLLARLQHAWRQASAGSDASCHAVAALFLSRAHSNPAHSTMQPPSAPPSTPVTLHDSTPNQASMVDDSAHGTKVAKGSPSFGDGTHSVAAATPRFSVPVDSENK